jgi:Spy/CpxP family protein refolding chaperone
MDKLNNSRWQVRAAALLIFVLGFVAGALALNAYRVLSRSHGSDDGRDRFERIVDRLELSGDQKAQVQQIFSEAREQVQSLRQESKPKFNEIRQQTDERLQKVLTPEQWQRFQQMRDETRDRDRRGGRRKGEGASPGG